MSGEALVIGAGPNGLAAAIRLAEAGRAVLVLEAAERPGGAVRTEELTLPGFHHDVFSAVYPAAAASPVFARMPLEEHGLQWSHPAAAMAHPLPDARAAILYRDLDQTAASLNALHPGDGGAWRDLVAPYLEHFEPFRATMLAGFPPIRGPFKLVTEAGPRRAVELGLLVPSSAERIGRRLFAGEGSRAWLYGSAMHIDTRVKSPGSGLAALYLNILGHAVGWPSPRGGSARLIDALVSYLQSLGGEVRCGARVEQILHAEGRTTGVALADGERIEAPVVVADLMPRALLRMARAGLPGWYRRLLAAYTYGQATVKVDWALDGPIPWLNEEVRGAGTIHLGGGEQRFTASIESAHEGVPRDPFLLVGQQSIADPTRAPAGKHTAWAYTHGPNADGHGRRGWDGGRDRPDWPAALPGLVERMEAKIEEFAPGFRDLILARHVLGPGAMEERNANLIGGDLGGGSYSFHQVIFRPIPSLTPYTTPLRGLYIGSAATFPGGAVHGVAGDAAARAALRRG